MVETLGRVHLVTEWIQGKFSYHFTIELPTLRLIFSFLLPFKNIHFCFELIQGGELYNRINQDGPLKEVHAALLFKQLLLAVQHMVSAAWNIN